MKLATEPDIYAPGIDDNGNYIDIMPSFNFNENGYYCFCGSRKDKVYETKTKLQNHTKTKHHQLSLKNLNLNKSNYYKQFEKSKEIIKAQKIMIGNLQKQIDTKSSTIDYLTNELNKKININNNIKIEDLIKF
jgi:hypothetical protein|tara:strand:- start:1232 stop:1630 length:399 start_codon:yes stop_codon:yes gene_type:complete